jgi:diguanylate cyclase (GGDEF)-like protein
VFISGRVNLSFPVILINVVPIVLILVITAYSFRERKNKVVKQFLIATVFMLIWSISSFVELAVVGHDYKILWRNITQIGVFYVPAASLFFAIEYSGSLKRFKRQLKLIVYPVQTISILLIFTDSWHHLMRESVNIVEKAGYCVVTVQSTVLAQVLIAFNFIYIFSACAILAIHVFRTAKKVKKQVLSPFWGMLIAGAYALAKVISNEKLWLYFPISGIFAIVSIVILWSIFRQNFLTVMPIALNEIFHKIDESLIVCSSDGRVIDINKTAENFFSLDDSNSLKTNSEKFDKVNAIINEKYPEWHEALNECIEKEIALTNVSGDISEYYQCNIYALGKSGHPVGTITVIRDVTEHKKETTRLTIRAEYDGMLRVLNRDTFTELAKQKISEADENKSLILFDLDGFKHINDKYGHMAGDHVLIKVCECVKGAIRSDDILGRMGGDEFAIFISGASNERALEIAETIRSKVEIEEFIYNGRDIPVTMSIGLAIGFFKSFKEMYKLADEALYEAKNAGKNCVKYNLNKI